MSETGFEVAVVRVFTTEAGELGNPLGIIRNPGATAGHEQAIAKELGFSETVFIESLEAGVATIRIFTPASELPFAGHPSVGTAWWLNEQGTPVTTLAERAGDVGVEYDGDISWIAGKAEWAPKFVWMPQATPAEVDALDPASVDPGAHYYAYSWISEAAGTLRSRMFAPEMGIAEDEATGAAAVAVTTLLGRDLDITQGRGSRLFTQQAPGGYVRVGGRTVFDRSILL